MYRTYLPRTPQVGISNFRLCSHHLYTVMPRSSRPPSLLSRRAAACAAAALCLPSSPPGLAWLPSIAPPLSPRLDAATLTPLAALGVASDPGELRYPSWLKGTWRVRNSISGFSMPLGKVFVDDFLRASAIEDVDAAVPLTYTLSFVDAPPPPSEPALSVAQDRRFNAVEETAAFCSTDGLVVTSGRYDVTATHPHGLILLEVGDADPRKGGAGAVGSRKDSATRGATAQIEIDIVWAAWDAAASKGAFVTSELAVQRTTLPADEYFDQPAVDTSYLEIITRFERPTTSPVLTQPGSSRSTSTATTTTVRARNRLVQYLTLPGVPSGVESRERAAKLARLADGRAVSFFDYDWVMEKVTDDQGLGSGFPV